MFTARYGLTLTSIPPIWTISWAPNNTNKWQVEFNSWFWALMCFSYKPRPVGNRRNYYGVEKNFYWGVHFRPSVRFWRNSSTNILQNFHEIWIQPFSPVSYPLSVIFIKLQSVTFVFHWMVGGNSYPYFSHFFINCGPTWHWIFPRVMLSNS